jgi:hypothetical protein
MAGKGKRGPEVGTSYKDPMMRSRTTGVSLRPYHRFVIEQLQGKTNYTNSDIIQKLLEGAAKEAGFTEAEFLKRPDAAKYALGSVTFSSKQIKNRKDGENL